MRCGRLYSFCITTQDMCRGHGKNKKQVLNLNLNLLLLKKDGQKPMKKKLLILVALSIILVSIPAIAAQGNKENGKAIYDKKCWWCHGENGAGDGPAAEFLNPPPRHFTAGWFKFKSTPFDEIF